MVLAEIALSWIADTCARIMHAKEAQFVCGFSVAVICNLYVRLACLKRGGKGVGVRVHVCVCVRVRAV